MPDIANPHDRFFKDVFGRPEQAADLVRFYLPPAVAALLDPDPAHLVLQPGTFVDPGLGEHASDLLFDARLRDGRPAHVYVLFEHKSRPEPLAAFQLLRYVVRVWERDVRAGRRLLPVIPIIVYHGRRRWRVPLTLGALFSGPQELRPYWPDFRYELVDVSRYGVTEVRGAALTRAALELLRAIFGRDLAHELPRILALVREIDDQATATEILHTMLAYAAGAGQAVTQADLEAAVTAVDMRTGGDTVTTLVETWLREGRAEGREQGLREGLLAGIELALELKLGTAGIALVPEIAAIPDTDTLRAVRDAIRTATTPDDVRRAYA